MNSKNMNHVSRINKKALRRSNSERAQTEESPSNLHFMPTTTGASTQLPPLAADLEGLAVSIGVLAGKVSPEQWELLNLLRSNLRAIAERVAALESNLVVPYAD